MFRTVSTGPAIDTCHSTVRKRIDDRTTPVHFTFVHHIDPVLGGRRPKFTGKAGISIRTVAAFNGIALTGAFVGAKQFAVEPRVFGTILRGLVLTVKTRIRLVGIVRLRAIAVIGEGPIVAAVRQRDTGGAIEAMGRSTGDLGNGTGGTIPGVGALTVHVVVPIFLIDPVQVLVALIGSGAFP